MFWRENRKPKRQTETQTVNKIPHSACQRRDSACQTLAVATCMHFIGRTACRMWGVHWDTTKFCAKGCADYMENSRRLVSLAMKIWPVQKWLKPSREILLIYIGKFSESKRRRQWFGWRTKTLCTSFSCRSSVCPQWSESCTSSWSGRKMRLIF